MTQTSITTLHTPQVRDWYVESFKELRAFSPIKDATDEVNFTKMLRSIYSRHAGVVPVGASSFYLGRRMHQY